MAFERVGVRAVIEGMREFDRDSERFNRKVGLMGRATKALSSPLSLAGKAFGGVGSSLLRMGEIAGGFLVANTLGRIADGFSRATSAAIDFGKESVMAAARVQELDVVLDLIGNRAGWTDEELDGMVEGIKELGIETKVAQKLLIQFNRYNLDMADATKLARVAQDAAVISMQDSSQALDGLMHGITTMNTRVLRTYGITIGSIVDAQDAYAASIGKTRDELTESEKMQAALNKVLAEGNKIQGAYEAAMGTAGKQARSMKRHIDELKNSLGAPFLGAFTTIIEQATKFLKYFREISGEGSTVQYVLQQLANFMERVALGTFGRFGGALDWTTEVIGGFIELMQDGLTPIAAFARQFGRMWGMDQGDLFNFLTKAVEKIKDLGPILMRIVLGPMGTFLTILGKIGKLIYEFSTGDRSFKEMVPEWLILVWEDLNDVIAKFGEWWDRNGATITGYVERIFGSLEDNSKNLAERFLPWLVEQLDKISIWFDENEIKITGAIGNIADWFTYTLGPAVTDLWDDVLGPFGGDVVDLLGEIGTLFADFFGGGDRVLTARGDIPVKENNFLSFMEEFDTIVSNFLQNILPQHWINFRDWVLDFLGLPNWQEVFASWEGVWDLLTIIIETFVANIKEQFTWKNLLQNLLETSPYMLERPDLSEYNRRGPGFDTTIPSGTTNNYQTNFTVNTTATAEPIIADLRMLEDLTPWGR